MRPRITGQLVVILTVRDLRRSADWYRNLLDAREHDYVDETGTLKQVTLTEPASGLQLCLVSHPDTSAEPFSERRPGLDHLEFLVASRADLDAWAARLDTLGVAHSGVKEPSYTSNAMLTFRDPDHIQLEFFWSAPARRRPWGFPRRPGGLDLVSKLRVCRCVTCRSWSSI